MNAALVWAPSASPGALSGSHTQFFSRLLGLLWWRTHSQSFLAFHEKYWSGVWKIVPYFGFVGYFLAMTLGFGAQEASHRGGVT